MAVTLSEKIGYALGDAAAGGITWKVMSIAFPFFFTNVFGLTVADAAALMLVARLFDVVTDPMMGAIADRTQSRWGTYRPWLIFGAIPLGLVFALLLYTPDLGPAGKRVYAYAMYLLMIAPIVIPGVILGISILSFTTTVADFFKNNFGIRLDFIRPSFWLVAFGQFSFISTYVCMVVSARLKKFDRTLEDAAYNLGANRFQVIWYITLKYLRPSIIGGLALSFLLSFENFNTTLFLVGAEFPLPIALFNRVRDGSTPVINAISFLLIFATSICAMVNLLLSRKKKED